MTETTPTWKTSPMFAVWSIDGTIVSASESYARLLGLEMTDVVGRRWPDLMPEEADFGWQQLRFSVDALRTAPVLVVDMPTNASGTTRWLRWTEWAIRDEAGALVQVRSTAVDVSELHEEREALAATIDAVVAARAAGRQEVVEQLHNGAVQQLTAARWALGDGDLHGALSLVDAALGAVRISVDALDPPAVALPLVSSVDVPVTWVQHPLTESPDHVAARLGDVMAAAVAESSVVLSSAGVVWASAQARSLLGDPAPMFDLGAVLAAAHPADRRHLATTITAALAGEPRQLLWRCHHPARGWRHLSTRFRPLPVIDGEARMVASITIDVTDEQERVLDQARSDERQRIARDLHDDALQQLAGLRWMLLSRGADGDVVAELDAVEASVRSLSARLHTPVWTQGLRISLDHLASAAATPTACEYRGDLDAVPRNMADRLWRVARELLRNVDRHAQASTATMTVEVSAEHVQLTVCDDGVGIDRETIDAARLAGHLGMVSMREAALRAGGTFEMVDRPEGGTRVTLTVPRAAQT